MSTDPRATAAVGSPQFIAPGAVAPRPVASAPEPSRPPGWRYKHETPAKGVKCEWYVDAAKKQACGDQADHYVSVKTRLVPDGARLPLCAEHKAEHDEIMHNTRRAQR